MSREQLSEAQFALAAAVILVTMAIFGSILMTQVGMTPAQVSQIVVPPIGFAAVILAQWRGSVRTEGGQDRLRQDIQDIHSAVNSGATATTKAAKDAADAATGLAMKAATSAEEAAYERGRASRDSDIAAAVERGFRHGHEATLRTIEAVNTATNSPTPEAMAVVSPIEQRVEPQPTDVAREKH